MHYLIQFVYEIHQFNHTNGSIFKKYHIPDRHIRILGKYMAYVRLTLYDKIYEPKIATRKRASLYSIDISLDYEQLNGDLFTRTHIEASKLHNDHYKIKQIIRYILNRRDTLHDEFYTIDCLNSQDIYYW